MSERPYSMYPPYGPGSAIAQHAQGIAVPPNELARNWKVIEETKGLSAKQQIQAEDAYTRAGPLFKRDAERLQSVPGFKRAPVPDYIILYGEFRELQVKVNESIAAGYYPNGNITIDNDAYYQSMVRKEMKGGNGRRKRNTRKVKKNY
jgi:hypothetical protein